MHQINAWDEVLSKDDSFSVLLDLAYLHARESGSLASWVSGLLADRDVHGLCGGTVPTSAPVSDYYNARQALAFFQKLEWLDLPGVDAEDVAWEKFQESERLCKKTNQVFRALTRGGFYFHPDVDAMLYRAQRKIASVLGPVPSLEQLGLRFGPGSTASIRRKDATLRSKLHRRITCSESLAPYADRILKQVPHIVDFHASWETLGTPDEADEIVGHVPVEILPGKLSFVPKKPGTRRTIVAEPMLNSLVQLGLGDYLVKRFRRFGLDLTDQKKNQDLAWMGSLTGALATLDLSSASDTIATRLVYHLLPIDWALFLDTIRSQTVSYKGKEIRLEKFSSMGNGFTFPLESLIFWALTTAACEPGETVSVYGDDIICPRARVGAVIRVLEACGFVVNTEKSFWTGTFRESCGKDYLLGILVRPYYQKKLVSGETLFTLHNHYVRTRQPEMAKHVLKYIGRDIRIYGPDGYGDGHLLGDWTPTPHGRELGWSGYTFETFTWKAARDFKRMPGDWMIPLYTIYQRGEGDEPSEPLPKRAKEGQPDRIGVSRHGKEGYKRIRIYTLSPS